MNTSHVLPTLSIALLAALVFPACSMTTSDFSRSPPHESSSEQHITSDELRQMIKEAREKFHVPAIAVALMDSHAIYRQAIEGVRVAGKPNPATLDDFFHIGSTAKSFLAVVAARLIERNQLQWNSRFFTLFPELAEEANPAYTDITLEDLLLSRAGLPAFTKAEKTELPKIDTKSVDEARIGFIRYVLKQPPASRKKDGQFESLYSNPSYVMASAMLERVSGLTYEQMAKRYLEQDLGITVRTGWPNSYGENQPWGHRIAGGRISRFSPENDYRIPEILAPAGNLSMTPRGYAKYTQLHLKGLRGEDNFISSESYQHIHFGYTGLSLGVSNGSFRGTRFSGFDGSATTFFARSVILPREDFAFTILTNSASEGGTSAAADWLTRRIIGEQLKLNWWERFLLWVW